MMIYLIKNKKKNGVIKNDERKKKVYIKFYLKKGKVYICYGSYELGHGTSTDEFSVIGKYK